MIKWKAGAELRLMSKESSEDLELPLRELTEEVHKVMHGGDRQSLAVDITGSAFQQYHLSSSLNGTNKLWERLNEVQSAQHTDAAQ